MRICETVMTPTLASMRAARDAANAPARNGRIGLVELRLDGLEPGEIDVTGALADRQLPVLVTCRPTSEGGKFTGSEEDRLAILTQAATLGAEFIDIEAEVEGRLPGSVARLAAACTGRTRIVVSHHDFTVGVPSDLASRLQQMRQLADSVGSRNITKVAITAERPRDCATLRRIAYGSGMPAGSIALAMGGAGVLSRLLPFRFGNEWTYAGSAAPGQLSVDDLVTRFRVADVTSATRVFGIAGSPLGHSASPAMHSAAFAAAGIDAVFVPVDTADAAELIEIIDALGFEGLSVTAPLKSRLLERPQVHADANAAEIGALNTLRRRSGGGWDGCNFDAAAFRAPLEAITAALTGQRAVVLGAGGAARAAVCELASLGASVEISARDAARAAALAAELGAKTTAWPPSGRAAVVVNATPVGTKPAFTQAPIAAGAIDAAVAYDLVYNPANTQFLQDARMRGARTIGGLEMLVAQAVRQFEWWTGARVEPRVFMQAAQEFIR